MIVQKNNGGCNFPTPPCGFGGGTLQVSFPNPVTSGDVIVVGVSAFSPCFTLSASPPVDTLGSSFTLVGPVVYNYGCNIAYLYYATLSSHGADMVSVSFFSGAAVMYIYEVSGVRTTGLGTGTGSGLGGNPTSTTPVTFEPGAFLLGMISGGCFDVPPSLGTGFTLDSDNSGTRCLFAQYSTSGAPSPTTFTTGTFGDNWGAIGIALNPNSGPVNVNLHLNTYKIVNLQVRVLQGSTVIAARTVTLTYASPNAKIVLVLPLGTFTIRITGYSIATQTKTIIFPPTTQTVNFNVS
jgi:hypothetical protein